MRTQLQAGIDQWIQAHRLTGAWRPKPLVSFNFDLFQLGIREVIGRAKTLFACSDCITVDRVLATCGLPENLLSSILREPLERIAGRTRRGKATDRINRGKTAGSRDVIQRVIDASGTEHDRAGRAAQSARPHRERPLPAETAPVHCSLLIGGNLGNRLGEPRGARAACDNGRQKDENLAQIGESRKLEVRSTKYEVRNKNTNFFASRFPYFELLTSNFLLRDASPLEP
jgi:hypothetical protein